MQKFNLGSGSNTQTGDNGQTVGTKLNVNFAELAQIIMGSAIWQSTSNESISLDGLATQEKTSLIAAINEVKNSVREIDDAKESSIIRTWSIDKIVTHTQGKIDALVNGAGSAFDTLAELADALGNDPNFAATLSGQIGEKVSFVVDQDLTTAQQNIVKANIGLDAAGIAAMGFIETYTDTNTQLNESDILNFGFIQSYTDTNTQRTDGEINALIDNKIPNLSNVAYKNQVNTFEFDQFFGGKVGIGTSSPTAKLHVYGGGDSIYSIYAKSATKWMYLHSGATDPAIGWDAGGSMRFGTATSNVGAGFSEKMRIDSNGNVGIGTSSPVAALQVGSITDTAMNQVIGKARIVGGNYVPSSTQMGTLDIASTTRNSVSPYNQGFGPSLTFSQNISNYVGGYEVVIGAIKTISTQTSNMGQEAAMTFLVNGGTSTGVVERMRIASDGKVSMTNNLEVGGIIKTSKTVSQTFTPSIQIGTTGTAAYSVSGIAWKNTTHNWDEAQIIVAREGTAASFGFDFKVSRNNTLTTALTIDSLKKATFSNDLEVGGTIRSSTNGNRPNGNISIGLTTNNTTKFSSITGTQYAYDTETEGFSIINGIGTSTKNTVCIGGALDEQNAATGIEFYTATNTTTRRGSAKMSIASGGNVSMTNNLGVGGSVTATSFSGDGSGLTNIPNTQRTDAEIQSVIQSYVDSGSFAINSYTEFIATTFFEYDVNVGGNVAASSFSGSGANVTNVNAAKVDGHSVWSGTQAAYDAIGTKDANTLYHII